MALLKQFDDTHRVYHITLVKHCLPYRRRVIRFPTLHNVSPSRDTISLETVSPSGDTISDHPQCKQCITKVMVHSMRIIKLLDPHTRRRAAAGKYSGIVDSRHEAAGIVVGIVDSRPARP